MKNLSGTRARHWRKRYEYQQRAIQEGMALTVNERLALVVHAMICGDGDKAHRETLELVRTARRRALLNRKQS